ncbi:MAG: ABC transporter substrate-binding protein [Sulfuriferula multivorans]|uniref:ABC transporter substrate-binding protein n=1 Tax=Sulfuriferula multivorans TaxID=1559896 RepID=A0A7C9P8G8_9PROT|nr:ABC transporter substrate-binding protein [Sulfuriferula multivorans]
MEKTMNIKPKTKILAAAAGMTLCLTNIAMAANDVIKIGFITDLSGVYADLDGPGGVEAMKLAIADIGGKIGDKKIELLIADHQNKPEIAANRVREWYDQQGVDVVVGGSNSSTALAMAKIAAEKKRVFISAGSGTTRLTNEECNPYTIQYTYDTVSVARVAATAIVKQGGKSWYFLTTDLAFGHSLEADSTQTVKANGGTVLGAARHPLGATDFSSFLLLAKASKAEVLGVAAGGGDLINIVKGANEFGITKSMKVATPLMFLTDIHALGLQQAQGLYFTDGWYWDQNDESRKWSKRYFEKMKKMPTMFHAGDYSATMQYFNAVKAVGTDADKVMAYFKQTKINDMFAKNGVVRPDGRMVHDMYLMQVKTPAESKYAWDYAKLIQTVPGDQVYMTKAESKCALWK